MTKKELIAENEKLRQQNSILRDRINRTITLVKRIREEDAAKKSEAQQNQA